MILQIDVVTNSQVAEVKVRWEQERKNFAKKKWKVTLIKNRAL